MIDAGGDGVGGGVLRADPDRDGGLRVAALRRSRDGRRGRNRIRDPTTTTQVSSTQVLTHG